ncbi:MAG TPA: hypothetical protein VGO55_09375 [Allosphingosinicella sp.]|nr:hypothetical protein [Allosphingosinicella sp.]
MKSFTVGTALALALAVSGCGDTMPPNEQAPAIRIANPGSDRLKALSPINQRAGLMRAIRGARESCSRIVGLAYQQQYRDLAMWVALCPEGRNWAVFIAPDESVQVRACGEAAQLSLPACRPVAPLPPDPTLPIGDINANELEAANANLTNAQ